jgi:hypothetical protein
MKWALLLLLVGGCGGLQVVQLTTRSEPRWQVTRQPAQAEAQQQQQQQQQQQPAPPAPEPQKP